MRSAHLRLVAIDGTQIAPASRRRSRDTALRRDREIMLAIIHEHLSHLTYSVERIKTLSGELEQSLDISLPEWTPPPLPDFPA